MQAMESGKAFFPGLPGTSPAGYASYGNPSMNLNTDAAAGKVVIQHFNCRSLSIGSWRRVGQSQMDLIIFYSPEKACITYYINNDSAGYKIEYPFAWIKNINLVQGDVSSAAEGASQQLGALVVELNRPPKFYMDSSGSGGFYECSDFTEDQQASQVMVHHLGGPSKILSGQLAKLVSLDTFQNRLLLNPALTVSAPVSPIGNRPASQPNHMLHPQSHIGMFQEQTLGLMGPPGPRGHKRQRSRSVPVAVDFSLLRRPVPPFMIHQQQHQGMMAPSPQMQDPAIFAPVPQHHHNPAFAQAQIGPNLSIDTSAGYGMDFRAQFTGPMSATTLNSPSDFGTPAFFATGPQVENMPQGVFSTPYNNSFLSIDPAAMIGTSNTPLSMMSGDPVIADHSPPFSGIGRSQSADIFSTPGDHTSLAEDTLSLDMYSKSMSTPFRSPLGEHSTNPYMATFSDDTFNFQSPPSASHKMDLPFRTHESHMVYQTPTHHPQQQQQLHQDSGVGFNSPSQMPSHDHNNQQMYQTPKENSSILYHDAKMYQSPAQLPESSSNYQTPANHMHHQHHFETPANQMQHDQSLYQSPLGGEPSQEEFDMQSFVQYGTIDPASL